MDGLGRVFLPKKHFLGKLFSDASGFLIYTEVSITALTVKLCTVYRQQSRQNFEIISILNQMVVWPL